MSGHEKGKPAARQGRKATGLKRETAGLPNGTSISISLPIDTREMKDRAPRMAWRRDCARAAVTKLGRCGPRSSASSSVLGERSIVGRLHLVREKYAIRTGGSGSSPESFSPRSIMPVGDYRGGDDGEYWTKH